MKKTFNCPVFSTRKGSRRVNVDLKGSNDQKCGFCGATLNISARWSNEAAATLAQLHGPDAVSELMADFVAMVHP